MYSDLNWLLNVKVLILVQNILLIYRYLQFCIPSIFKASYLYGSYGTLFTECQDMRKSLGKLFHNEAQNFMMLHLNFHIYSFDFTKYFSKYIADNTSHSVTLQCQPNQMELRLMVSKSIFM